MIGKKKSRTVLITEGAAIAALYVALSFASNMAGLANGAIQLRLSEALTVLPVFTVAAVPGLFAGCLLSNLLTGCAVWDIVFGSTATLIGAIFTYLLRKRRLLSPLPPIVSNTLIIPFILRYVYVIEGSIPYFMLTVGIGELLSCGVLGYTLLFALEKKAKRLF